MKKILIGVACFFFLFVPHVSAQEGYTIDEVTVHANILPNGDLAVEEFFTYTFYKQYGEEPFNGTTRWIYERKTDGLAYFNAFLAGSEAPLKVEKDSSVFKIHSQSMDETKTFHYAYKVKNAIKKYRDTADFYWKFFDDSNESTIHNLTLYIHLPETVESEDLDLYAHDITDSEIVQEVGDTIVYRIDTLPAHEMAEARIFFPQELLTDKPVDQDKDILATARKQEERLKSRIDHSEARTFLVKNVTLGLIALYLFATIYLFFFRKDKRIAGKLKKKQQAWEAPVMQLTAVHRNGDFRFQDVTTSLLDLAHRDIIDLTKTLDDEHEYYVLTLQPSKLPHVKPYERYLLEWLFSDAGEGDTLTFAQINKYVRRQKKQFKQRFREWRGLMERDLGVEQLYLPYRWYPIIRIWLIVQGPLLLLLYLYVDVRILWPVAAGMGMTVLLTLLISLFHYGKIQNIGWWMTYAPLVTVVAVEVRTIYTLFIFLLFVSSTYLYFFMPKVHFTAEGLQHKARARLLKKWLKQKGKTKMSDSKRLDRLFLYACALGLSRLFIVHHNTYYPLHILRQHATAPVSSSTGSGSFGGGGGGGGGGGAGTF